MDSPASSTSFHDLLHTFCHLKTERGFEYLEGPAFLCHRCSGIYTGFMICFVLAAFLRWNGRWSSGGHRYQAYISAGLLLASCGLQVLTQQWDALLWMGGGWIRYIAGCAVGLALVQVVCSQWHEPSESSSDNPSGSSPSSATLQVSGRSACRSGLWWILPVALVLHAWLLQGHYLYHRLSVLSSLLALYAVINHLLLKSWMEKARPWLLALGIAVAIAVEWLFLYYMNVGRHHV